MQGLPALPETALGYLLPEGQNVLVVLKDSGALNRLSVALDFWDKQHHVFLDWETLPYDALSVASEIVSERIAFLFDPPSGIVLTTTAALCQKITPKSFLQGRHFNLKVGDVFDQHAQSARLIEAGYQRVTQVFESGQFAMRGDIIDIFAMGQVLPFRLDLFDDEISGIRFFDPSTQRTLSDAEFARLKDDIKTPHFPASSKVNAFCILPALEFDLEAKEIFAMRFGEMFTRISPKKIPWFQEIMAGNLPAGAQYYQPLFFTQEAWGGGTGVLDYLEGETPLVLGDGVLEQIDALHEMACRRYEERRHDLDMPQLAPDVLFFAPNETRAQLKQHPRLIVGDVRHLQVVNATFAPDRDMHFVGPTLLVAQNPARLDAISQYLKQKNTQAPLMNFQEFLSELPPLGLALGAIDGGMATKEWTILTENELFGRLILPARAKIKQGISTEFLIEHLNQITEGDLVVHIKHGIGRYQGLATLDVDEGSDEFIHLQYAGDDKIYVPVAEITQIGRYTGALDVPLAAIGSSRWDKIKQKALESIHDTAAELLGVLAQRHDTLGIEFDFDADEYARFEDAFPYQETPDQACAIASVKADMMASTPMNRLICGDVGFGKTEVAMRAAFIAVLAGYQVAVLVPTTLLCQQHFERFVNRFADFGVHIATLSRLSGKDAKATLEGLKSHRVDVVIGTHKLLQDEVSFANLGLLVVDEEHRFGVRDKAKILALKASVDTLIMTATPIPRTLNMAMSGMQDMSLITTAPARRLAIKTFVLESSDALYKEAIVREVLRGGQVFVLHNDVQSIDAFAEGLGRLLPDIKMRVAHGQMTPKALNQVMDDFYHKRFYVLVASTIIETGIDIPNANTILINRADRFGIAQLHQLRGRVGRSHQQGYCYLLVEDKKCLSGDAKKRLNAVKSANTLGAGFMLATEDLNIRGAGELLGKAQSGNMQAIGFELYTDMLERTKQALKEGRAPTLEQMYQTQEVNLHAPALIPKEYMPDAHERLLFYKKLAGTNSLDELTDHIQALKDRFGALPMPLLTLQWVHECRILSCALGISRIDATKNTIALYFVPNPAVDAKAVIDLLQSQAGFRMKGHKVSYSAPLESIATRAKKTLDILHFLTGYL